MNATQARSVVVTGAGSGIGRAIAGRLLCDGWAVVALDRDSNALDDALGELRSISTEVRTVTGDVADRATHRTARRTAAELAPLGAWVGAAGITRAQDLAALDEQASREVVEINQLGMLWGAAEAVEEWITTGRRGVFIAISSVHGQRAFPHHAVYEMTKAAADALARNIAVTYGPLGIRAVGVAPGAVSTPALNASLDSAADPDAARRHLEQQTPARRLASPEEVAAAVGFLISDAAAYVSGTTLLVDGGWVAALGRPPDEPTADRPL